MKNLIKRIFSSQTDQKNELKKAIETDDVRRTYKLLKNGVNPNIRISYIRERYVDDQDTETYEELACPLSIAHSQAMKRLLQYFGALSLEEAQKIWAEEDKERAEHLLKQQKHLAAQKAAKELADKAFLDKVLKN